MIRGFGVHDAAVSAFTMARFRRSRCCEFRTYALPALDTAARTFYETQGFEVRPIDVSSIYRLNGSLGCLVNVIARGP
jgi:hypothetical protein